MNHSEHICSLIRAKVQRYVISFHSRNILQILFETDESYCFILINWNFRE